MKVFNKCYPGRSEGGVILQSLLSWPKRDDLYRYLDALLDVPVNNDDMIALLIIDIDNFRSFCELLGYRNIEEFLAVIGNCIKENCPPESLVAWLGSDEFAVVLSSTCEASAKEVAASICQSLNQPCEFRNKKIQITLSLGYAFFPDHADDRYKLLKKASLATSWVKKHGKNNFTKYETSMSSELNRKLNLINDFNAAIWENQFRLQYQPQVNVETKAIVGAEALLRWQHPELGLIPPLDFIPFAEESGHIHKIGDWVLYQASKDFNGWLEKGCLLERLAVNVSILQLQREDFPRRVLEILEKTHLDPAYLELEITESQFMDLPQVRPQIEFLRNYGIRFALDDFGTGFASLDHLRYMGFDTIKIDKAYIHNIITSNRDQVIVGSILNMATLLQLGIIAEGVETDDQWRYIKRTSIKEVQGYYCSPPVDESIFASLLKGSCL